MENASKALLIAGAVLIVILLIGIGMLIYSRSTGVVDTAASTMNTQEIQAFNSQFTPYEGKQTGSSVRVLLSTVISHNGTNVNNTEKQVQVTGSYVDGEETKMLENSTTSSDIALLSADIDPAGSYTVKFAYGADGLIDTVTIN